MEEEENPILVSVGGSLGHHSKRLITWQWQLDLFFSTFGKKCIFPFEITKTLFQKGQKGVLNAQNVSCTMQIAGCTKLEVPPRAPGGPLPLYKKFTKGNFQFP